jgi:hypothetical protein
MVFADNGDETSCVQSGYRQTVMDGGRKSYGVVLALSSPGHVMGDLHAGER